MNKKRKYIIILFLLLLSLSVGFALLQANLKINGSSKIQGSSWDIHFENLNISEGSVSLSTGDVAASIQSSRTDITYTVALNTPGDYYEFTVDAVNTGTVDGMVESVTSKLNNEPITTLPSYLNYSVTYLTDDDIEINHLLKAGDSETYKVRIEFKKDITSTDMPNTAQTLSFSFGVVYVQADSNGIEVEHPFTGTKHTSNIFDRNRETYLAKTNNTLVWIGRKITDNIVAYDSFLDARNALSQISGNVERPISLRHRIVNDIVTETYAEFEITEAIAAANPGLIAGTYEVRGAGGTNCSLVGSSWKCDEVSPFYESNVNLLKTIFGEDNCEETVSQEVELTSIECTVSGIKAFVRAGGVAVVRDTEYTCEIYPDGASGCVQYNS